MTKTLEKGENKIQAICDELKERTLEPAKKEAERIVIEAQNHAEKIIRDGHERAEEIIETAHQKMEQERMVFQSALEQAAKQAIESLRQKIERDLFNPVLYEEVESSTANAKWIAKLIDAMVKAIEQKGIEADLEAIVAETVDPKEVNAHLAKKILKRLKDETVQLGDFLGGAKVKAVKKQLTLVLTDEVIQGLLSSYLRKDFRELFFS